MSALGQALSLFQSEFSTQCDPALPVQFPVSSLFLKVIQYLLTSSSSSSCHLYSSLYLSFGNVVAQCLRCCVTNRKVAGSIPAGVSDIDIKSFRSHYGPGVDSASNRDEYQEYFLRGKSGRCVRLTTLSPSLTTVTKSGTLNFLEPSGNLGPVMGLI